jgi:hypothetical protein
VPIGEYNCRPIFSSEQFAEFLGDYQDRNRLPLVFAVGSADGFSDSAQAAAQHTISPGKMTLAHEGTGGSAGAGLSGVYDPEGAPVSFRALVGRWCCGALCY